MGRTTASAPWFADFKSLVHIHLKEVLKLDQITENVPMHAVALLVVVAYETLSKSLHPGMGPEYLFALEHQKRHAVPTALGGAIFDSLRNGLAHRYSPYPILVEGVGEVRLVMTWKDGAAGHLRCVNAQMGADGRQRLSPFPKGSTDTPTVVCLNAESLRADLDSLLEELGATLAGNAQLAARFQASVQKNLETYTRKAEGNAACEWRDFLTARRLERP